MQVVYGKKPRNSKTSEVFTIIDTSFFLYNAKSTTRGLCEVYLNEEPYPLIMVSESNEKAKKFIQSNFAKIQDRIASTAFTETITREEFCKPIKVDKEVRRDSNYPTVAEMQKIHNKIIEEIRCQGKQELA